MQESGPIQHRKLYSHPVLRLEARRELAEWEPYFQCLSEDSSKTPKQRSDARLLVEFAKWARGEFDRAEEIVEWLDIEIIEAEIAGLESWISDMHWREQERLQESVDLARLRIDNLSEQLLKSSKYLEHSDPLSPDDFIDGVGADTLVRQRSEYRGYLDKIALDLRVRYGTAMDSLDVPNGAAIRYRLEMIGSAEFEPHPPKPTTLNVLLSPEEFTEEDFLKILRDLEADSQLRRAHEPIQESGIHLTDIPETLTAEETAPTRLEELRAPTQPTTKYQPDVHPGTNDNKAGEIPLPEMDFSTAEGRYQAVDDFIAYIFATTGKQIYKTRIWKRRKLVGGQQVGYKDPSSFKDWQRGVASKPATRYFEAVLRLKHRIF